MTAFLPMTNVARNTKINDADGRYIEFVKATFPRRPFLKEHENSPRLRQWRCLQGGSSGVQRTGCSGLCLWQHSKWPQYQ